MKYGARIVLCPAYNGVLGLIHSLYFTKCLLKKTISRGSSANEL